MKVTYLGDKEHIELNGYSFNGNETIEVSDKQAIMKFAGNMYFHADCPENYVAPKYYIYQIIAQRVAKNESGEERTKILRNNVKGKGFATEQECEDWISENGGIVNRTHYIKRDNLDIIDAPESLCYAIFQKKSDGTLYKKPLVTFDSKDKAEMHILEEDLNPDDYEIMVK